MKVLMFGWEYPPFISGGLGTACLGITKGLLSYDVEIDLVLPKVQGDSSATKVNIIDASKVFIEDHEDIKQYYTDRLNIVGVDTILRPYMTEESYSSSLQEISVLESARSQATRIQLEFSGGYGKNLFEEVYRLKAIGKQLGHTTNAQVIHAHDWMTFPAAISAKHASGLPLVIHVHATEFDRMTHNVNTTLYEIEREGMHEADAIIAVSGRTKEMIVAHYGIDPEKVSVVYNAVEKNNIIQENLPAKIFKEKVVLFLGRITSQKGPSYFLETARLVLEKNKHVRFVMAGSGDLLPEMVRLCASMRLQDKFHFTGFLSGRDLENIFALSDVFVMPSVSEPFGIVPIEAMQYDLPVIISKQSGVSEILPHAIKVDFWDTEMFAKSILELLKNKKTKDQQIKENWKVLDKIHWNFSAQDIIEVYKKVM